MNAIEQMPLLTIIPQLEEHNLLYVKLIINKKKKKKKLKPENALQLYCCIGNWVIAKCFDHWSSLVKFLLQVVVTQLHLPGKTLGAHP